jgi:hypothetical protein
MATRTPPRFVPTLTEVVPGMATPASTPPVLAEEQLVHRILQRIDLTLDRRIREAIAAVVLEQSRALAPALRQEIEIVVSEVVSQALSEELGTEGKPAAKR